MRKRSATRLARLVGAGIALGLTHAANAASVLITSPDLTFGYGSGDTITLEVYVTANAGETDDAVNGWILYPSALVSPIAPAQQNALPGGWTASVPVCTTTRCVAFSQVRMAGPAAVNVTNFLISTIQFLVLPNPNNIVVVQFDWLAAPASPSTQWLDFFGVTSAPGYTTPIPEPTTAALLGAGLLGLGLARRRRGTSR